MAAAEGRKSFEIIWDAFDVVGSNRSFPVSLGMVKVR